MDISHAMLELEERNMAEMRKMERAIVGRMELLHTQLNSKLYFIESKLDALMDCNGLQQQQQMQQGPQMQFQPRKRDPMHHRMHQQLQNGGSGNNNNGMMVQQHAPRDNMRHGGRRVYSNGGGGRHEYRDSFYYDENDDDNRSEATTKNGGRSSGDAASENGTTISSNFMPPIPRYNSNNNNHHNHHNGGGMNGGGTYYNNNGTGNNNNHFHNGPRNNNNRNSFHGMPVPQRMPGGGHPLQHHGSSSTLYPLSGPGSVQGPGSMSPNNTIGQGQLAPLGNVPHRVPSSYRCPNPNKQRKQHNKELNPRCMNNNSNSNSSYFSNGFGSALNKMAAANRWTINGVPIGQDEQQQQQQQPLSPRSGNGNQNGTLANGNGQPSEPLRQTHGTSGKHHSRWTARATMGIYTDEEEDEDEEESGSQMSGTDSDDDYKEALQENGTENGTADGTAPQASADAQAENSGETVENAAAGILQEKENVNGILQEKGNKKSTTTDQENKGPPPPADAAVTPAIEQASLVGGFAQALSRMAAANKWSMRAPPPQTHAMPTVATGANRIPIGGGIGGSVGPPPPTLIIEGKSEHHPNLQNGAENEIGMVEPPQIGTENEIGTNGPTQIGKEYEIGTENGHQKLASAPLKKPPKSEKGEKKKSEEEISTQRRKSF